jgi:hypothetical protein
MPLSRAIPTKSSIRTEWDQSNEGTIDGFTRVYWAASPTFNNGSMFSYIYDTAGHTQIEIKKSGVVIISLSLGSQGGGWENLSLMTSLLNEDTNNSVFDVFYELPVPASGSLYPTSSCLIRQVTAGEKYSIVVVPTGRTVAYDEINSLSAWSIVEA